MLLLQTKKKKGQAAFLRGVNGIEDYIMRYNNDRD